MIVPAWEVVAVVLIATVLCYFIAWAVVKLVNLLFIWFMIQVWRNKS